MTHGLGSREDMKEEFQSLGLTVIVFAFHVQISFQTLYPCVANVDPAFEIVSWEQAEDDFFSRLVYRSMKAQR